MRLRTLLLFPALACGGDATAPNGTSNSADPCNTMGFTGSANASYSDSAFVANRFRVVQRRFHL